MPCSRSSLFVFFASKACGECLIGAIAIGDTFHFEVGFPRIALRFILFLHESNLVGVVFHLVFIHHAFLAWRVGSHDNGRRGFSSESCSMAR